MRLSFSDDNTEEDIDYILEIVPEIVSYLRSMSPLWERLKAGSSGLIDNPLKFV